MSFVSLLVGCVLGIIGTTVCAEIGEDDTVLLLNDEVFQKALDENQLILVKFYAPWCGNSKELAPAYANASKLLRFKNSEIKLAKMDATENARTAMRYSIKSYPTIKFFRSSLPIDYKGEETSDGIVNWVEKMSKSPLHKLNSLQDVQEFNDKHDISVIGMFKDQRSWAVNNVVAAAEYLDGFGYAFGITSHPDVFTSFNVTNDELVLFKHFEEGRNDFKGKRGWSVDQITKFIISNSLPDFIEFRPELAPRIFENENGALFFITSSLGEYASHKELAKPIGQDFKGRMVTVMVDVNEDRNKKLLDTLGVQINEAPAIRFAKGKKEKYAPKDKDISEASIGAFISDIHRGKIKPIPHTRSEEIPKDWNAGPVNVLVGKNFHEVVNGNKKVFVFLYTPSCRTCLDLEPIWQQLGEELKGRHDLLIAKMDLSMNDIDLLDVQKFPTMLLFNRSDKRHVRFNDEPTMEKLVKFLGSQGIWLRNIRDEL
jgi:protein disulfide-isomerase A1